MESSGSWTNVPFLAHRRAAAAGISMPDPIHAPCNRPSARWPRSRGGVAEERRAGAKRADMMSLCQIAGGTELGDFGTRGETGAPCLEQQLGFGWIDEDRGERVK